MTNTNQGIERMSSNLQYENMTLTVELVTPAIAKRWLERNDTNRRLRARYVAMYAQDMQAGNWYAKPLAVCFDRDSQLGNGQHTLHAIIASGKQQNLLVARGCTKEQIAAMDVGLKRSVSDIAHFLDVDIDNRRAALAKIMKWGIEEKATHSFAEVYEAYVENEEAICFVIERTQSKVTGLNASTLSVVALAYRSRNRDDLARFLEVLVTGVTKEPRDQTVIRLRDFCRSLRGAATKEVRIDIHKRTTAALEAFLSGKALTKLYGTKRNVFGNGRLLGARANAGDTPESP